MTSRSTDTLLTFIYLLLGCVLIRTHGCFTVQFQFSDLVSTGNAEGKMLTLSDRSTSGSWTEITSQLEETALDTFNKPVVVINPINSGSRNSKLKPKKLTGDPSDSAEPPEIVSGYIERHLCKAVRIQNSQKEAAKNISRTSAN